MSSHMTVSSVLPRIRYVADGTTTSYEYPFAIFKNSDLKVYLGSTLQNASTYTVSGAGDSDGGEVVFATAPTNQTIITLSRELSIARTTDFQEGGALRADTLNDEFDYQIACQQQLADSLNRSMVLPPYAADTNVSLVLPTPSAGKAIIWNSAGTNLENSTVSINELEGSIRGYRDAAAASATQAANQVTLAQAQVSAASEQVSLAQAQVTAATNQVSLAQAQVSAAAEQVSLAEDQVDAATEQAQIATTQAGIATTQAGLAADAVSGVSTQLSGKANVDMDNLSTTGKSSMAGLVMPAATGTGLTFGSSGTEYTATSNGWFALYASGASNGSYIELSNASTVLGILGGGFQFYSTAGTARLTIPAKTGDRVKLYYLGSFNVKYLYFIPSKGG